MKPNPDWISIDTNVARIEKMLLELVLRPRRDLVKWAQLTKQTPNIKLGYVGQHFASLVTGVEGARTGARGHDLADESEVKSCSRLDQLDKCRNCRAAVARHETACPRCGSSRIKRNEDSKWLFAVKSEEELRTLLDVVPRVVLILSDYPFYAADDWNTLRFQVFEIWPAYDRHRHFRSLMENYYHNIYLRHIQLNPRKTPAPKNLWPYSFQFYMCNPIRTFHCTVHDSLGSPSVEILDYVDPSMDRSRLTPVRMPLSRLSQTEKDAFRSQFGSAAYDDAVRSGIDESQRLRMDLRDTDHATPQSGRYRRGKR